MGTRFRSWSADRPRRRVCVGRAMVMIQPWLRLKPWRQFKPGMPLSHTTRIAIIKRFLQGRKNESRRTYRDSAWRFSGLSLSESRPRGPGWSRAGGAWPWPSTPSASSSNGGIRQGQSRPSFALRALKGAGAMSRVIYFSASGRVNSVPHSGQRNSVASRRSRPHLMQMPRSMRDCRM